jgi:hypothetical protein
MTEKKDERQAVQINTIDEMSRGRYSNTMLVAHGPEEFIMDWMLHAPNGAHLVSRLIVAPGNMKRIVKALQDNIDRYEKNFGQIRVIESPTIITQ